MFLWVSLVEIIFSNHTSARYLLDTAEINGQWTEFIIINIIYLKWLSKWVNDTIMGVAVDFKAQIWFNIELLSLTA